MDSICRRLAVEEKDEVTAYPGPIYGERATPAQLDALYGAFPGITIYADAVAKSLPGLVASDSDAALARDDTRIREQAIRGRWPGIRDPLGEHHPIAVRLRRKLEQRPDAVPEPEPAIAGTLEALGCVRVGRIVTFRGVPVPAGGAQTAYFLVLRFRALFGPFADPARVWRDDPAYDVVNVTDEMQESILLVSTRIHRDNLVLLQKRAPELYLAIWMREAEEAERLAATADPADLPPCYPRSRLGDPRRCLLLVCDVMAEYERGFDLLHALRFIGGVTRTSVRAALASSSSMTHIHAVADATHRHIAAGIAHLRSIHPTMNSGAPAAGPDPAYQATGCAFAGSRVYADRYRHVVWVAGDMPTRFFLGLEPTMLLPVMLIQMRETMIAHEGQFWLGARGRLDPFKGSFATRLMSLAVIGTSTICVPTVRAMMHDDGLLLDSLWLRRDVAPLVRNPALEDGLSKAEKLRDDVSIHDAAVTKVPRPTCALGDSETFKSGYAGACHRAKLCSAPVGEPGWPQGFRLDAWRQPLAEVAFLRSCCRYVRYDEKHVPTRDRWNRIAAASGPVIGPPKTAIDVRTGLPRQHMLERVQDLFRPWFNQFQVIEETKGAEDSDAWLRREALVREIAPLLPGLSAITDDPYLNERFWVDRRSAKVRIAVQGAWQS